MAWEHAQPLVDGTRVAGADLSGHRFRFVKLAADGTVGAITAATDEPYGVLQNSPREGEEAAVCLIGITKLEAGAELLTAGEIQTDAAGLGTSAGANTVHGVIIQGAGAGEIATVAVDALNR